MTTQFKTAGVDVPISVAGLLPKTRRFPVQPNSSGRPTANIDWPSLSAKLPVGMDIPAQTKRKELFRKFDVNGNGYLSLAEVDKAVRDVLMCDSLFKSKPAVLRAFQAARRANGHSAGAAGDYVQFNEFRTLLQGLRCYFELYAAFAKLDVSADGRLSIEEFRRGASKLKPPIQPSEVDAEFERLDANGGGLVLFDEFAAWAVGRRLPLVETAAAASPSPRPSSAQQHGFGEAAAQLRREQVQQQEAYTQEAYYAQANAAAFGLPPPPPKALPTRAFAGKPQTPRPSSARAPPGVVGWRGGGTSGRAQLFGDKGRVEPPSDAADIERRQQAQQAVAASASSAFARAKPPAPAAPDLKAIRRKQALGATAEMARRKASASLTVDQMEERAWSEQHRKSKPHGPHADFVTNPPRKHVPSDTDPFFGKPSGDRRDVDLATVQAGQVVQPGHRAGPITERVSRDSLETDTREWRCQRCHVLQRPTALSCVTCAKMRNGRQPDLTSRQWGRQH